jgi:hypothetical protein
VKQLRPRAAGPAHPSGTDFRIGGLKPGETKRIRGTLYIMDPDVNALLARYRADFPEHLAASTRNRERTGGDQLREERRVSLEMLMIPSRGLLE